MAFSPIKDIEGVSPARTLEQWASNYKDAFIEHQHDTSALTLVLPDDCLVLFGPPRLAHATGDDVFYPVGFLNNIQYTEGRDVRPTKTIGSRRFIFAATNQPVQVSVARMMLLNGNLAHALYGYAEFGSDMYKNSRFHAKSEDQAAWYTNLEEDLYRVPVGIGIVYNSPATAVGRKYTAGAEYLEACYFVNRSMSITSGEAMVMEQAQLVADRVVPWDRFNVIRAKMDKVVQEVSTLG